MTDAPEYNLPIDRDSTTGVYFAFKTGVNADPMDMTGSTFALVISDALGNVLLTIAGVIETAQKRVRFDISLEQRATLPRGRNGRYVVTRSTVDDNDVTSQVPLARGNTIISGGA